jgi:hypothetical protein
VTDLQTKAHEYFRQEGFIPVDETSYSVYRNFYDKGDSLLQEMSAMVCATATAFEFTAVYKVIHGYLCTVWFYPAGELYVSLQPPPGGSGVSLQQVVDTLYGLSGRGGLSSLQIYAVEERFIKDYEQIEGYSIKTEYRDNYSEYAYRTRDILELSGGINFYKRKRLNRCFNTPNVSLLPMTKENFRTCFDVENEWCSHQDCAYCKSFIGCEKKAIEVVARIFDEQIHTGLFLYCDGMPKGYVICEQKDNRVVYLYYGKANLPDFYVYLIYMAVKNYFSGVEYLNMGYDLGITGLRMFKQHLSAYELWRKYLCTFTRQGETK